MNHFFTKSIPLNIIFCICYFCLATLGFKWGALTANATLLWPPSGLAVFACLVFGSRVIPGLLLGAIASSQSVSLVNISSNDSLAYLLSVVNSSASILQAYLIARLSRVYYSKDFRVPLGAAFKFTLMVLGACTLAATLGSLSLWQAKIVSGAGTIQNWVVWWSGDAIGVLIVTPLLLWVHHRKIFFKQSQENAFLIFSVGVGLVLLVAATVGHKERETFKTSLVHAADLLEAHLQSNIDLVTRDLGHFDSLNADSAEEQFRVNAEAFLERNPQIVSLNLVSTSAGGSEQAFGKNLTVSRAISGEIVWNSDRYREARDSSLAAVFSEQKAFSNDQNLLWLRPIADQKSWVQTLGFPINTCVNYTQNCASAYLVAAELDLNAITRASLEHVSLAGLSLQLVIKTPQQVLSNLEWSGTQWRPIVNDEDLIKSPIRNDLKKIPSVKFAGAEWELLFGASNLPNQLKPTLLQCGILVIGLTLVALLSAYLQALFRHDQIIVENQEKLKEEISTQTEALRSANDWLLQEMESKRKTQEQLEASEAHLRTLLDTIPDPVWLKSPEGRYISFNKAVTELFYRDENEVAGKRASDYVDKEFAEAIKQFEMAALASDTAVRRDLWMHIPSKNEHRLMDTIKIAMRDHNNTAIGILSIARDITEQHQLIVELEKFKRFAEFASEGLSIMSLTADTLYTNPSMQKMLLIEHDAGHNHFLSYFPNDLHEQWHQSIFPYVLNKGYWQGELAALRADGSRFPTKAIFFVIRDDKGQPLYIGEIMSDISEQKQIEQSLQLAKQAAEEATQAKSRFLANMSHEIRTPLNAVLGYSQLLMTDTQLSTQQQERLQSILSAGQRLLHLINDILDLSKIEAGVLHFRQDYFDLNHELQDIYTIMHTKATGKGLALSCDIQLPNPAIVKSDRQKIGQVVLNLLGNAIKFTQVGEIKLRAYLDEKIICVDVIDTGPGISPQEQQSLFSAFKQGKAGEESGGTGLGLVISKHIAESLGGEIILESEQGKGTRATLKLPLPIEYAADVEHRPAVANAKLAAGFSCSVLVVEDDVASRDFLVSLLRNMGCDTREAYSGKAGLTAALQQKPDIIFTDIRMPELTGTEMLKELRKTFSKEDLPVVAVSASSLEHERTFYLAEGFHEFIGKPYEFSDIYRTLENLTGVQFIRLDNADQQEEKLENERACWTDPNELRNLHSQLVELKASLASGDSNNSKKLFKSHTPQALGKTSYQRIANAIKQYDLVLAERYLDELLQEMGAIIH